VDVQTGRFTRWKPDSPANPVGGLEQSALRNSWDWLAQSRKGRQEPQNLCGFAQDYL